MIKPSRTKKLRLGVMGIVLPYYRAAARRNPHRLPQREHRIKDRPDGPAQPVRERIRIGRRSTPTEELRAIRLVLNAGKIRRCGHQNVRAPDGFLARSPRPPVRMRVRGPSTAPRPKTRTSSTANWSAY